MADLLMEADTPLPLSFSLGGTNLFQSGRQAQHYVMNTDGVEQFGGLNPEFDWNNHRIEHYLRILNAAEDTFSRAYAQNPRGARKQRDVEFSSCGYSDDWCDLWNDRESC